MPVVVVGELLVDIVRTSDGAVAEHIGGSPANVAMGVARLGHPTQLACVIGTDQRGQRCRAHVEAAGVQLTEGSQSAAFPTSTADATIDATGAATYVFDLNWELPPVALPASTRHVHTGSIATTLLPGAAEVTAALQRGRDLGTTSYDPNIRPTIMGTPDQVRPRVEELVALSDVVKCSEDDLAWLYPELSPSAVMAHWCALGAALTVVTLGGAGVTWRLANTPHEGQAASRTAPAEVVDTVGAGDSFMAGLISGLLDLDLLGSSEARSALSTASLDDIAPALDRALRTSGTTVTHAGAYAPTREEI